MGKNIFLNMAGGIRDWLASSFGLSPVGVNVTMAAINILVVIIFLLVSVLFMDWLERRYCGWMQERQGPNRVGPFGIFIGIVDVLKLISKEIFIPKSVDRKVYKAASYIIFVPATVIWAVFPFDKGMQIADLNVGIFFVISISSLTTMIFLMAGWSSNSKYSLLGGMRTVAVMISYEVAYVFSILGVVMMTGSLKMSSIVEAQRHTWFIIPQFIAFFVFFISAAAEANRAPFDQVEGEQELTGGAITEYSGMRWAFFYLTEYANLIAVSAIGATLFLGGYLAPFGLTFIPGWIWFIIKIYVMIFLFMWIRWTWPRVRIDHMLSFGWKFLIPVSLANVLVTGIGIYVVQNVLPRLGW